MRASGRCNLFFYAPQVRQRYAQYFHAVRSGMVRASIAMACLAGSVAVAAIFGDDGIAAVAVLLVIAVIWSLAAAYELSSRPPLRRGVGFGEICRLVMCWSLLAVLLGATTAWLAKKPAYLVLPLIAFFVGQLLCCADIVGRLRSPARRVLCAAAAVAVAGALACLLLHPPRAFLIRSLIAAFGLAAISLGAAAQQLPRIRG